MARLMGAAAACGTYAAPLLRTRSATASPAAPAAWGAVTIITTGAADVVIAANSF